MRKVVFILLFLSIFFFTGIPGMTINFLEEGVCPVYRPLLDDWKRFNVIYGGASSGKSYFEPQRKVLRTLEYKGYNSLCIRKVNATNHDSTYAEIEKRIYADFGEQTKDYFQINRSRGAEEITCVNGNKILFRGLDDVQKVKSITTKTGPIVSIWIEEATEITFEDLNQLNLRLRGKSHLPKQITLTFNPISALHWAKKYFFDIPLPGEMCTVLKTTYHDNPFLDEEDRAAIELLKTTDPLYYQVYGLGEWGIIGEIVFHNYVIEDFKYTADELKNKSYGIDFGYHFSTLISIGWRDEELYIFDEVYLKKKTNPEFIEHLNSFGDKYKNIDIVADSAEPDRIKEFKKAGYRVRPAKKGPGTIKMGVDFLVSKRLHIHKMKCPNTANEIQLFQHRKDKDGNVLDEFIEINDHCIDGIRYATEYLWGKFIPKVLINERLR